MRKVVMNLMLLCAAMVAHSQLMAVPPQFATTVSEITEMNLGGGMAVEMPNLSDQMIWSNFILEHKATASPIIQPVLLFGSSPIASKLYEGSAAKYKMNGVVSVTGNLSFAAPEAVLNNSANDASGGHSNPFAPPGGNTSDMDTDNFLPVGNIPWVMIIIGAIIVALRIRKRAKA